MGKSMANTKSLAFIGLGIMGLPMAGHLLEAGNQLTVFTRTRSKAEGLLGKGAKWAESAAGAARSAEIVFMCLPDTPDVENVVGQIVPEARAGQIVVDHSTISPSATRGMAEQLAGKGATLLDAPISGGDVGARNATLSIMVGGPAEAFAAVEPYLKLMGKTITHCGPSGAGQLTKLTNQILVSLTNLATCEAIAFAVKNGLDGQKTLAALGGGAGSSWQFNNLGPRMLAGDFAPGSQTGEHPDRRPRPSSCHGLRTGQVDRVGLRADRERRDHGHPVLHVARAGERAPRLDHDGDRRSWLGCDSLRPLDGQGPVYR